jgi:hypothetical protein
MLSSEAFDSMPIPKPTPSKAMDLHGIRSALNSQNNQVRAAVIDGIQSGDILLIKGVSEELKKVDEKAYKEFTNIGSKKYIPVRSKHQAHGAMLAEQYGSSIFSADPSAERFESVSLCMKEGLTLISADKALKEHKKIVATCAVNGVTVMDISEL